MTRCQPALQFRFDRGHIERFEARRISVGLFNLRTDVVVVDGSRLALDKLIVNVRRGVLAVREAAAGVDGRELFGSQRSLMSCFHAVSIADAFESRQFEPLRREVTADCSRHRVPAAYYKRRRPPVRPAQPSIVNNHVTQEDSSGTQCGMRTRSNVRMTAIAGVGGNALGSAAFFKLRS